MPTVEPKPVIDTSKMSAGERETLELTESAREAAQSERGFAGGLFMGRFNLARIHPFPLQSVEDRDRGDAFLKRLETFVKEHVDPDEIDHTGEIPQEVIDGLASMGAFGIKISPEFGGLGLSQTNYCRAGMKLGSYCGNLTALVSAHQSIGVPQPLILFGTEEQKRRFLPRVAQGEISAFALTEIRVGSDPAKMETHAEPTPAGEAFILNGEKLWCTNGLKAGVIVVMAKTPPKMVNGKSKNQITAFATGLRYRDPDSLPLRVGTAILGRGFTGRLMGVVRDREGLTYSISAQVAEDSITDGDWSIAASFAPSLLDRGIASTRRELDKWWRDGISESELSARKQGIVGGYLVSLSDTRGLASSILSFVQRGYDLDYLDGYPEAVKALTREQVNGAIHSRLDPSKMVLVEAGSVGAPPPGAPPPGAPRSGMPPRAPPPPSPPPSPPKTGSP